MEPLRPSVLLEHDPNRTDNGLSHEFSSLAFTKPAVDAANSANGVQQKVVSLKRQKMSGPDNPNLDVLQIIRKVAEEVDAANKERGEKSKKGLAAATSQEQTPDAGAGAGPNETQEVNSEPKLPESAPKARKPRKRQRQDDAVENPIVAVPEDVHQSTEIPEQEAIGDALKEKGAEEAAVVDVEKTQENPGQEMEALSANDSENEEEGSTPGETQRAAANSVESYSGERTDSVERNSEKNRKFLKTIKEVAGDVPPSMPLGSVLLRMREKAMESLTSLALSEEKGSEKEDECEGEGREDADILRDGSGRASEESLEYRPSVRRMTGQRPYTIAPAAKGAPRKGRKKKGSDSDGEEDSEYVPEMEDEAPKRGKNRRAAPKKIVLERPPMRKGPIPKGVERPPMRKGPIPKVVVEQVGDEQGGEQVKKVVKRRRTKKGADPLDNFDYNPEAPPLTGMSDDPDVSSRQCEKCFIVFKTKDKLKRHFLAHTTNYEAHCSFCGTHIKYKYNLKNHMKKCGQRLRRENEKVNLAESHLDFLKALDEAAKDPTLLLPDPNLPYEVDRDGFVTGFDPDITVNLDEMIPNYSNAEEAMIDLSDLVDGYGFDLSDIYGDQIPVKPKRATRGRKPKAKQVD